ncbi:MAG: saccharopine dehydrogenase C-terminal domain-containing protein [Longimicrobiales bacterium]
MRFLVLGAGAQGSACALDLARTKGVSRVILGDMDPGRPRDFLRSHVGKEIELRVVDATVAGEVRAAMREVDAVACALPYYFNAPMTRLAIECGVHFCDLGGNTDIVDKQIAMDAEATAAGVSVVPDCGLAPGMVNILAQGGIDAMDAVEAVRMFVGGLPQHPHPPLNYQVVYSLEGVLDYYTTPVLVLEDGKVAEKESLTEVESIDFPVPLGTLEAFLTAGGASRMPYRYEGKVPSMSYKTLRYPGHAHLVKAMRELGLFDSEPVKVHGWMVSPREVFIATVGPHLQDDGGHDLVALRVVVTGTKDGKPKTVTYELLDFYDEERGVTAMMRTTGYSLAAVARLQVEGVIRPGARPPYDCVPVDAYVRNLGERGVRIERREG